MNERIDVNSMRARAKKKVCIGGPSLSFEECH